MSLLPYYFDIEHPWFRRFFDQQLKLFTPDFSHLKPFWQDGSSIKTDKDKWQINIDVLQFAPEEISVKTADGYVVVEGKHEEKEDQHGYVSRQFIRRFKLPEGANLDMVESKLSSDGVLTVTVPYKAEAVKGERTVPITHTGPIRKDVAEDNNQVTEKKE